MDTGQIILGLGAIAGATVAIIKVVGEVSSRRKCECSRTGDFERNSARLDNIERDSKRTWDAIQDLYNKHDRATSLYHDAQIIVAKILAKLEK